MLHFTSSRSSISGISTTCSLALLLLLIGGGRSVAQNWTRFRGENGSGISTQKGIPTTWSPGDYIWNIELPGVGHSSPVVWKEKLFITSAIEQGAQRFLFCLKIETGEDIWSRKISLNKSQKHTYNSFASSTPATDGERVYVAFADNERYTLAAYDFDGNLVWRRSLGPFEGNHGLGVSPVIFEELVIIPKDQEGPSFIIAFDRKTGRTVWSTLRSFYRMSYATPIIVRNKGEKPQLICSSGAMGVSSLNPYTGQFNWSTGEFPEPRRTVGSPVFADGLVVQNCGGAGKGNLMIVVDISDPKNATRERIRYSRDRILPYVPTPISYQGHLYLWNDNGVVSCVETATGKNVWTERVGGTYFGSPICIDGKLYVMSAKGEMIVMAASPQYKLYGKTPLDGPSHATPAVAGGRLYIRTFHRLTCLEAKP